MMLFPPIVHIEQIEKSSLNKCLVEWEHKMGPWKRPNFGNAHFHALFHNGEPVALAVDDQLIAETAGGFPRSEALELARICAKRRDLNRVMLRLWREFIFPAFGKSWAISYQDAVIHGGDLYRFDGWTRIGTSNSGTDRRSGLKGRKKVIWGWKMPEEPAYTKKHIADGNIVISPGNGLVRNEMTQDDARAIADPVLLITALKHAIQELEHSGYCFDHPSLQQKRAALAAAGVQL